MRYILIIIIAFVTNPIFAQNWQIYKNHDYNFSVYSPGDLLINEQDILTDAGPNHVVSHGYKGSESDNNLFYQIIHYHIDIPTDSKIILDTFYNNVLKTIIDGSRLESNSELLYESVNTDDLPQALWKLNVNDQMFIKSKALIANNRIFILQVMTLVEHSMNDEIDQFLNSFRVEDKK